jgi:membrane-bound metal-dependent hydrolase YbcI (DUF457 family)
MYVGHLAAGMALKAKEPKAPTWALLLGVGMLDILFGPFVLMGIEHATMTPEISPGFRLDYIDWSHSLVMSIVWSILFGMLFWKLGRAVATIIGLSVFSHFMLDVPMHPADLALWPNSSVHLGLGLWQRLPHGWWFVELAVIALAWGYYWRKSRGSTLFGGRPIAVAVVLLALHVFNSPWFASYN